MICWMMWTKLKLGKMVDRKILKAAPGIHIPTKRGIPWDILKFPGGGLSIRKTQVEKPKDYTTRNFDPNNDSDGSQPLKLSNNPAVVASRQLRMRKRRRDDEQLPLLHPPHLNVVLHISGVSNTAGMSNTTSASNTAGAINTMGTSSSNATGASGTAGAGRMLLILTLQGARIMVGADNNAGASGSTSTNQPFLTAFPRNPCNNLRMLEIRANMDAFAIPPVLERALCGSNSIAL